ncbi:MAG: cysteine hydrolase [Gemmobacter sp.]|nr:cysteine hydrolase [Gemmobacter sp.]
MTPAKCALLAIDLQNEYRSGAAWPCVDYEGVLARTAALMAEARAVGVSVIHVQAWVPPEARAGCTLQEATIAPEHRSAVAESDAAAICAEVAPMAGDLIHLKRWPSAFRETALEAKLREMGVEELLVTGVLTDSCVTGTVFDAVYSGLRCWVVKDCCSSMTEMMHRTGLLNMANRLYGGGILRQAEALKALRGEPHRLWRCTRPVEFPYTAEALDRMYDSL